MEEELNGGGIIDFTKDLGKKSIEIAARLENKSKELSGKLEGNSKKLYNSTLEKITAEGSIYRTLVDTIKNIEVLNKTIKAGGKSIEVLFDGTKDGLLEEIKSKLKSVVTKEIKNAVEKIPGGSLVITTSCIILKNLLNTIKKEYKEHGVPNSKVESFLDIIDESIDKIENSAEEIKIAKLEKRVDNIEAKFPDTMDQETILDKSVATHVATSVATLAVANPNATHDLLLRIPMLIAIKRPHD